MAHDLVVRDAYTIEHDAVVDIAVDDGRIAEVGDVPGDGREEIDADGRFVSPGLVDCHLHVDKAFAAEGGRVPAGNENAFDFAEIHEHEREYYRNASTEDVTQNAVRDLEMAVAAGTTHARSHVTVDTDVRRTDNMRATVEARERTDDLIDLQLVPAAGDDLTEEGQALLREAIEMGADDGSTPDPVLLGGSDPATRNRDVERTLEAWFEIATDLDVDMDLHVHDGGNLCIYTLERLAAHMEEHGYEGRVTASHSYGLAHIPDWWVEEVIDRLAEVDMRLVTCYQSTRPTMPVKELLGSEVVLGHGTDNDCDFVFPHGNADLVEAALVLMNKLHGDRVFDEEYRWFDSNEGLEALWRLITYESARVLGLEEYGIEAGNPADLVVLDAPSPQWAIARGADRPYVIKDGAVVARDGEVVAGVDSLE